MSDRTLVVHAASLEQIVESIAQTHDQLVSRATDLLGGADRELSAWVTGTSSRAAETAHRQRILEGVERLAAALEQLRSTTVEVAEKAHDAEVKNVALLD